MGLVTEFLKFLKKIDTQYYFHSKDELIRATFSYVGDQFLTALDALSGDVSFDRLRQAIWLWLPLDHDREKAARAWLAFTAAAATNPELAAESERLDVSLRSWFAGELETLQHSGDLDGSCDVTSTAAQLLGLIDGVTLQSLVIPATEDRHRLIADTIDAFLLQHLASQSEHSAERDS